MNEVVVGLNRIRCWPELRHVCTVLPDGSEVPASPNHTPADVALAHELGYGGDTWMLTLGHEVSHTYLAVVFDGLDCSPTLWWVAHQHEPCPIAGLVAAEEGMVMEFQRALNGQRPVDVDWEDLLPGARALIATLMGEAT